MKKIYLSLIVLGLIFTGIGCTDDFEEINTRKDAVTQVEPAFFFVNMLQNPVRNYQRNTNLYPDFYSQYWANIVSGFESPRYEYVDGWIGNQWKEFYTKVVDQSKQLDEWYGDDPVYTNAIAIKEIWMCYEWSRQSDTYGALPYFGAGVGESVPYNSQEEIYTDLFKRLDAAVKALSDDDSQYDYGTYDLFYNGDVEKWKRFGNSLRLRLAMRISNVDPAKAQTEAEAAIAGGVMSSNDDVAHIPIWSGGWYDYLHQMAVSWDNIRISKTFTDHLYDQSSVGEDPRAPLWLTYKTYEDETPLIDQSTFKGIANGYDIVPADKKWYATMHVDGGYIGFSGDEANDIAYYLPIMFYSEVQFLLAEAALRGWNAGGDANTLYEAGVQASMDFVGVSADDAEAYIDGLEDLSGSNEGQLEQIITQKWIANFPNGVEGWADFRRTDYPDLQFPVDGVSGNASVAPNTWVKRIRYPDNQHNLNEENMPEALNSYEKDRMDTKLWWDVSDTNSNF